MEKKYELIDETVSGKSYMHNEQRKGKYSIKMKMKIFYKNHSSSPKQLYHCYYLCLDYHTYTISSLAYAKEQHLEPVRVNTIEDAAQIMLDERFARYVWKLSNAKIHFRCKTNEYAEILRERRQAVRPSP